MVGSVVSLLCRRSSSRTADLSLSCDCKHTPPHTGTHTRTHIHTHIYIPMQTRMHKSSSTVSQSTQSVRISERIIQSFSVHNISNSQLTIEIKWQQVSLLILESCDCFQSGCLLDGSDSHLSFHFLQIFPRALWDNCQCSDNY